MLKCEMIFKFAFFDISEMWEMLKSKFDIGREMGEVKKIEKNQRCTHGGQGGMT